MKKLLQFPCIVLALLFSADLAAQVRTEYLDNLWNTTTVVENAKYTREITLNPADSSYTVLVKYITGEVMMEGRYQDHALDIEHGDFKYWYGNGKPESQGRFKDGYKVGTWKRWTSEGIAKPDRTYPDEKFVFTTRTNRGAQYPGGMIALQKLVTDSLVYPEEAKNRGLEGTVYITFTIDETGDVRLPEVSDGVHYLLDEEALRFVSTLPAWTPASRNGTPVESSYIMPITFDLGGSGSNGNSGKGNSSN